MSDTTYDDQGEIREGDIVFNCPYCGKSMSIEGAGAGLVVPCARCRKDVQVPVPTIGTPSIPAAPPPPDPYQMLRELDASLAMANRQIEKLIAEKEALLERRAFLEQIRVGSAMRLEQVAGELNVLQDALDRALVLLAEAKAEKPL